MSPSPCEMSGTGEPGSHLHRKRGKKDISRCQLKPVLLRWVQSLRKAVSNLFVFQMFLPPLISTSKIKVNFEENKQKYMPHKFGVGRNQTKETQTLKMYFLLTILSFQRFFFKKANKTLLLLLTYKNTGKL